MQRNDIILFSLLLCLFIGSRLFGIFLFTPHIDEVNYIMVSDKIAHDWSENKYIPLDGRMGDDYKQPLLFWLYALTSKVFENPLLGARCWSLIASSCAFVFMFFFIRQMFDREVSYWYSALIITSEYFFYFDSIGLAEVIVYGFGTGFIFCLFRFLSSFRYRYLLLALLFMTATITTKESAKIYFVVGFVLFLYSLSERYTEGGKLSKRKVGKSFFAFCLVVAVPLFLNRLLRPFRYDSVQEKSLQKELVNNISDVFNFQIEEWIANIQFFWRSVIAVEFQSIEIPVVLIALMATVIVYWRGEKLLQRRYTLLLVFIVATIAPIVFLAKIPRVRYFIMCLPFLFLAFSVLLSFSSNLLHSKVRNTIITVFICALIVKAVILSYEVACWHQTDIAMEETEPGWANGANMFEVISYLKTVPDGSLYVEIQWGHPASTVLIFSDYYPQLQVKRFTMNWKDTFLPALYSHYLEDKKMYILYDERDKKDPYAFTPIVEQLVDCSAKKSITKVFKNTVFLNSKIVLCSIDIEKTLFQKIHSHNPHVLNNIGCDAARLKQFDKAVLCWLKVTEIAPDAPLPHKNLATYYAEKKDLKRYKHNIQAFERINQKQSE